MMVKVRVVVAQHVRGQPLFDFVAKAALFSILKFTLKDYLMQVCPHEH